MDISCNNLGDYCQYMITSVSYLTNLQFLNLAQNCLSRRHIGIIKEFLLEKKQLLELNISRNELTMELLLEKNASINNNNIN
jgi:hypothetical protein